MPNERVWMRCGLILRHGLGRRNVVGRGIARYTCGFGGIVMVDESGDDGLLSMSCSEKVMLMMRLLSRASSSLRQNCVKRQKICRGSSFVILVLCSAKKSSLSLSPWSTIRKADEAQLQ